MSRNLKRFYGIDDDTWKRICAFYQNKCLKCGKRFLPDTLSVDHVKPIKKGGKSCVKNYQPLCLDCNKKKGVAVVDYRYDKGKILDKYLNTSLPIQLSLDEINPSIENYVDEDGQLYLTLPDICQSSFVLPAPPKRLRHKYLEIMRKFSKAVILYANDSAMIILCTYVMLIEVVELSDEHSKYIKQLSEYGKINN